MAATMQQTVSRFSLLVLIGLISLGCFCVYELADVNKVARLIFGVVDEPNAATEGGFYKPTRL